MSKRKNLSKDDRAIWDHVRASIRPMENRVAPTHAELDVLLDELTPPSHRAVFTGIKANPKAATVHIDLRKITPIAHTEGMLKSTRRAVSRGQLEPTMRIDLHGDRLEIAHRRFCTFINSAVSTRQKMVLVVTGKGGHHRQSDFGLEVSGVIRRALPEWINSAAIGSVVSHYCPAHVRHGGEGAFYLFIRAAARR